MSFVRNLVALFVLLPATASATTLIPNPSLTLDPIDDDMVDVVVDLDRAAAAPDASTLRWLKVTGCEDTASEGREWTVDLAEGVDLIDGFTSLLPQADWCGVTVSIDVVLEDDSVVEVEAQVVSELAIPRDFLVIADEQ